MKGPLSPGGGGDNSRWDLGAFSVGFWGICLRSGALSLDLGAFSPQVLDHFPWVLNNFPIEF